MGIEKGIKKSRNLMLLNFDFETFLGFVEQPQCCELLMLLGLVFLWFFSLEVMWKDAGSLKDLRV